MRGTSLKIIYNIMIIFMLLIIPMKTFAMDSLGDMVSDAEAFIQKGSETETIKESDLKAFVNPVGQILTSLATAILVIVTVVMGIKYMLSGPEEQGKLKKQLIGLVVSTLVVFGAQAIWATMYDLLKDF